MAVAAAAAVAVADIVRRNICGATFGSLHRASIGPPNMDFKPCVQEPGHACILFILAIGSRH